MNAITSNIETVSVIATVAAAFLTAAYAIRANSYESIVDPNVPLPDLVAAYASDAAQGIVSANVPWAAEQKPANSLRRADMTGPVPGQAQPQCTVLAALGRPCLEAQVGQSLAAYALELPVLGNPSRPEEPGWYAYQTTYRLSTTRHFTTGWPTQYPAATVIGVPRDTPAHVKYLMDAEGPEGDGLRALMLQNGQPLNMNVDQRLGLGSHGLNVTGDFAHAFVFVNQSDHDMFFLRDSVPLDGALAGSVYYRLKPESWTLFWPAVRYWTNAGSSRRWWASSLEPALHDTYKASYIAEVMMFEYLRTIAPLPSNP